MQVLVLIEQKSVWTNKPFVYDVPNDLEKDVLLGKRVIVPFGKRSLSGFILKVFLENGEYDYKLKNIISIVDDVPVLNEELLFLGKKMAMETISPLIASYQAMLPTFLKAKIRNNERSQVKVLSLLKNKKEVNDYIALNQRAKEQINILKSLLENGEVNKSDYGSSSVRVLIEKGIIEENSFDRLKAVNSEIKIKDKKIVLTEEQTKAIVSVELNKANTYLLFGVTGSGKTEVYIRLIKKVLEEDKTAILLVPEISLTPALTAIFKNAFGSDVAVLHSNLTNLEKYSEWKKIQNKEVRIVIGARSAIFAPLENLGIIIIDEEHSGTYKQEISPRYHAIEIAKERSKYNDCPLILGSATPSLESYARAKSGIYNLLVLSKRPDNATLPSVSIVDMKEEIESGNRGILSTILINKIKEKLDNNEQIMILLNKRGYNSVFSCRECGHTVKCPHCDVSLTYHKNSNMLRCHYCGYATNKVEECPECNSKAMRSFGFGTEYLEEELKKSFLNAKIARMDFDTVSKRGSHSKIIKDFSEHKYDILVGTQMIAKGHDFPKVTLMAILNIDQSLNIPDFRSAENTFSLINQASGRAGRANLKGEVIIQTFNPDNYSIISKTYDDFYKKEIEIRKKLFYPPFCNLALIKIGSKNINTAMDEIEKVLAA